MGAQPGNAQFSGTARELRIAKAMLGFGLPLSNEGIRLPNKIGGFKRTQGTETSKYLEEKKETSIPSVAASEIGRAQTKIRLGVAGALS